MDETMISSAPKPVTETLIPTMSFRWLVPSFQAYGEQPTCRRLQQLYHTSTGAKWIDVRMVEEQPSPLTGVAAPAPTAGSRPYWNDLGHGVCNFPGAKGDVS